ncbi:DUF5060 domain-containing protein [Fodinibius roseus]|uniref:DUF5060 domain-containing protein n=1 Tax=Fodinibius roseus TaxID=1194090 RepID=UPI0009FC731D|nr:DUF5060 domain-containing protein [Fodinibius roseus]
MKRITQIKFLVVTFLVFPFALVNCKNNPGNNPDNASVTGELKKWHKVTLSFQGPSHSETDENPNPYKDYRLTVTFTHNGQSYNVPGYFAADGDAGETSASQGNIWRVHFTPDAEGTWKWEANFVSGEQIALNTRKEAGNPVEGIHGQTGSFEIQPTDKSGQDFRARGNLAYTGKHYLQFQETGQYYFKTANNVPEVFLQYDGFDNTTSDRGYQPHVKNWNEGDPTWQDGKGKGIIGAVNYMAGQGVNEQYFLTQNNYGDGNEAFPWTGKDNYYQYDCSKLDQWQRVFDYMMQKGVVTHFVLGETEVEMYFEKVENQFPFADSRKLYYREMVARFGYLNGVIWNIGEEQGWDRSENNTYGAATTTEQRKLFAAYVDSLVYKNDMITLHNGPSGTPDVFFDLAGFESINGLSFQGNYEQEENGHGQVLDLYKMSEANNHPWVIHYDEPYMGGKLPELDVRRKKSLWASITAGAAGIGFYNNMDVRLEDFRVLDSIYQTMGHARELFQEHLPFHEMQPADELVSKGWCFAKEGDTYLIYLKDGGSTNVSLPDDNSYQVEWYNPRKGGDLLKGSIESINGEGSHSIGSPPRDNNRDWVCLVMKRD